MVNIQNRIILNSLKHAAEIQVFNDIARFKNRL